MASSANWDVRDHGEDVRDVSATLRAQIAYLPQIKEHPCGSTKYLCCYLMPNGQTLAIERKGKRTATIWMRAKDRPNYFLDNVTAELSYPWPEPGRYGRNSNLRRLPELANETLLRIKVPSADSGIKFLRSVMNS